MPSIDTSVNVLLMIWGSFVTRVVMPLAAFIEAAWPNAYWNIGYFIFIVWMYLFHAPFRVHSNARTDWYAQLTKTMQAWCGITITLFHLAPRYMEMHRQHHHPAGGTEGGNEVDVEEGNPGGVFFPTFAAFLFWFLVLHRYKRTYGLRITYAATATVLFLNALLVALFLTVHYTYCEHNEAAREMPLWFSKWVDATLPPWLGGVIGYVVSAWLSTNHLFWWYACPAAFESNPLSTITHLVIIGLLFVLADYLYKRGRGYDHVRGILWCVAVKPNALPLKARKAPRRAGGVRRRAAAAAAGAAVAPVSSGDSFPNTPASNGSLSTSASIITAPTMRATTEATGVDDSDEDDTTVEEQLQQPDNPPSMVPWFSTLIAHTAFQLFVGSNLNFLSFDYRGTERSVTPKIFKIIPTLRRALRGNNGSAPTPSSPKSSSAGVASPSASSSSISTTVTEESDELWFDWVADVGDGFNSTYAIARMLAQPALQVDVPPATRLRRHQRVARKISEAVHNVTQRGKTLRESLIHSTTNLKHSFSSTLLMGDDTLSSLGGSSDGDDTNANTTTARQRQQRVVKAHSPRRSASAEVRRGRSHSTIDSPVTPSTITQTTKRASQRGRTTEGIIHSDSDTASTTSPSSLASPSTWCFCAQRWRFGVPQSHR
ncbi:transmembrane protein, putative [Bodo saltans]|uniref:Transmembrane protein, putative n=1 Tax=Bodo saltans TaxID=75058 RepID=A0A0S4IY24_BODSA|nr:transmembrane protein, putative [Bodo saltans]|eukprot:CUG07894.1 transmembrane protein, putative [Bodo saltans]